MCTSAQLRMPFADHTRLSTSSIISQHYCKLKSSRKCHLSRQWWRNYAKRPLLMVYFLKCLETYPFRWRWFCRCAINRLGHAFCRTRNIFTKGTLIPIYSACSFAETSEKLLLLCVFHTHARAFPRVNLYYFFLSCMRNASKSDFSKFRHKRFGYSRGEN